MKCIMLSIKPQWCEKIASGRKTIEVRKSAPKKTPFKCYIYCCKSNPYLYRVDDDDNFELARTLRAKVDGYVKDYNEQNGKVIGEFICDKVDKFYCVSVPYQKENNLGYGQFIDNGVYKVNNWHEGIAFERNDNYIDSMLNNNDLKKMCLTAQELFDYIGVGKHLYGWHISDLKIYDKPESIMQFYKPCPIKIKNCPVCELYSTYTGCCMNNIDHPPQSWCYVEEI